MTFPDPKHSIQETRYLIMGQSYQGRLLGVAYRGGSKIVRLISAREATRRERRAYEEEL